MNKIGNFRKVYVLGILMALLMTSCTIVIATDAQSTVTTEKTNIKIVTGSDSGSHSLGQVTMTKRIDKVDVLQSYIMSKEKMLTLAMTNTSVYAGKIGSSPVWLDPTNAPGIQDVHQSPSLSVNSSGYYWVTYEMYYTAASNWYPVLARSLDATGTTWKVSIMNIPGARQPGLSIVKNVTRGTDDYWWSFTQAYSVTGVYIFYCDESKIYSNGWSGGGFDLATDFGFPVVQTAQSAVHTVWNNTMDCIGLECLFQESISYTWQSIMLFNYENGNGYWDGIYTWPGVQGAITFADQICKGDLFINKQSSPYVEFFWAQSMKNITNPSDVNWDVQGWYGSNLSASLQYHFNITRERNDTNAFFAASGGSFYFFYQTDVGPGVYNIHLLFNSAWGTTSWGSEIKVTTGSTNNCMPVAAINQATPASAHVQYVHDNQLYYKHSTDSGLTWSAETQVSDASAKVSTDWHGTSIALIADSPFHAWTDARNSAAAPTITGVVPASGMINIPASQSLTINFSKAIVPSSFLFSITPDPGSWSYSWSGADSQVTLAHAVDFSYLTKYTVSILNGTDTLGQNIPSLPYTWGFKIIQPPLSVNLTQPNSTSVWAIGSTRNINFTVAWGAGMYVYWLNYTINSGTNWNTISSAQGIPCVLGNNSFAWYVPMPTTMQAEVSVHVMDAANALATQTSSMFQINQTNIDHLYIRPILSTPRPITAGRPFALNITAKSSTNTTISSFNGTALLLDTTGTLSLKVTGNFKAGFWQGNVFITKAQTGVIITATNWSKGGSSNAFTVIAGAVAQYRFGNISSPQKSGVLFTINLTAMDAYNNTVTTGTVRSPTLSDTTGTIWPTTTGPFTAGFWSGQVMILTAQDGVIITATRRAITSNSNPFNVTAGTLNKFYFDQISSPQTAGANFAITVHATDQFNNTITSFNSTVILSDSTGTLTPTATGNFTNGTWTGNVAVTKAMTGDALHATNGTLNGDSNTFDVNAAGINSFYFNAIPSPQGSGIMFSVTINAKDIYNNTATSFTGTATLSDTTGTISPTTTGAFAAGIWTGNVIISQVHTGVTITATSGTSTGTSNAFDIVQGLDHFYIATISSPQTAGTAFSMTITAKDINNNTVIPFQATASLMDSTTTITPKTTGTFTAGVWTGNVVITKAQTGVSIIIGAIGKTSTSNMFDVASGVLSHFILSTIPSPQTADAPFSFTITAKDAYSNTVSSFTSSATLSDLTSTITPTSTGSFTSGIWSGNVTIFNAKTNDTITVSSNGKNATTNKFNVIAAVMDHLYISTISSPQTTGASFTITITAMDASNITFPGFTDTATLTDTTGTITPTTTGSFVSGIWTGAVTISKSQTGVAITATTSGGKTGTSNSFNVGQYQTGYIQGFVYQTGTTQPVVGANISVENGQSTTTNSLGHYNVSANAGTRNVTASMTGYVSNTTAVVVTVGLTVIQNFYLTPTQSLALTLQTNLTSLVSGNTLKITVHVTDGSSLVQGASVVLTSDSGGSFNLASGTTDANGDFTSVFTTPTITKTTTVVITAHVTKTGYIGMTKTINVSVTPVSSSSSSSSTFLTTTMAIGLLVVLIIIILLVVLYLKFRQKPQPAEPGKEDDTKEDGPEPAKDDSETDTKKDDEDLSKDSDIKPEDK